MPTESAKLLSVAVTFILPKGDDRDHDTRTYIDIKQDAKFDDGDTRRSSSGVRIVSQDAKDTSFQNV